MGRAESGPFLCPQLSLQSGWGISVYGIAGTNGHD